MPSRNSATPSGSKHELHLDTGGRSLRSHHRLPYEPPPAAMCPTPSSLVNRRLQNLRAPRRLSKLVVQRTQRFFSEDFLCVLCASVVNTPRQPTITPPTNKSDTHPH